MEKTRDWQGHVIAIGTNVRCNVHGTKGKVTKIEHHETRNGTKVMLNGVWYDSDMVEVVIDVSDIARDERFID